MEVFIGILIYLAIVAIEWSLKLLFWVIQLFIWLFKLPFKIAAKEASKPKKSYNHKRRKKSYSDPIEKALDRFENHPEDMDLEDEYWIDDILGDD